MEDGRGVENSVGAHTPQGDRKETASPGERCAKTKKGRFQSRRRGPDLCFKAFGRHSPKTLETPSR